MSKTPLKDPKPSELSVEAIGELAEMFRVQVGFTQGMSLANLVNKLGGRILLVDILEMSAKNTAWLTVHGEKNFEIRAYFHHVKEDKLDLSMALAHYVLHYLYPKKTGKNPEPFSMHRFGTRSSSLSRREAEWFSACFLMPEKKFSEDYVAAQSSESFAKLVLFDYELPAGVIKARAKGLGLN